MLFVEMFLQRWGLNTKNFLKVMGQPKVIVCAQIIYILLPLLIIRLITSSASRKFLVRVRVKHRMCTLF